MMNAKILILLLATNLATSSSYASILSCEPRLMSYWTYDDDSNTSNFKENKDNLTTIKLHFDYGFIKLGEKDAVDFNLLKQNEITQLNEDDHLHVMVRYENSNRINIEQQSLIIVDPMCKKELVSKVSVITTSYKEYRVINYVCGCLSSTFDSDNFLFSK